MGRHSMRSRCMSAALSTAISVCLVMGMLPLSAFADNSSSGGSPEPTDEGAHISQDVVLEDAVAPKPDVAPVGVQTESLEPVGTVPPGDQMSVDVSIDAKNPGDAPSKTILVDGLIYSMRSDGESVALTGWYGVAPKGDLVVPSSIQDGVKTYLVSAIGRDGEGSKPLFADCYELQSITLPVSLAEFDVAVLVGCSSLSVITISDKNEHFSTSDGMLFTKGYKELLLVPEGKEGAAHIPDQTEQVPVFAFSHCVELSSILVGTGSVSFSSYNGALYTKDMKTLVVSPMNASEAVVIPLETTAIGANAFSGCAVKSLVVLGVIESIEDTAFSGETKAEAIVVLAGGDDFKARKAVWEGAGFSKFAEPAAPGDSVGPMGDGGSAGVAEASGFAYTLLPDMTLSLSWQGMVEPDASLVIPSSAEIKGVSYRVSTIAAHAFEERVIHSVTVPASVTTIGDVAFARCSVLSSVSLPEGLCAIGSSAFEFTALEQIVLPTTLSSIGERAFASNPSMLRVIALADISNVSNSAIEGCAGLSVLTPFREDGAYAWKPGISALGNHVEPYGTELSDESLRLKVGETSDLFSGIPAQLPENCKLSYSYTAASVSVDSDGMVVGKKEGLSEVSAIVSIDGIVLANSSRSVEVFAQTILDAPDQETDSALKEKLPLTGVTRTIEGIAATLIPPFEKEVNGITFKFEVLTFDEEAKIGTVSIAKSDNVANEPVGDIAIPSQVTHDGVAYTVTTVAKEGFYLSQKLTSITLPSTVKSLSQRAFRECTSLMEVTLFEGLESIEREAFLGCGFASINLPNSLKNIATEAFQDNNLEEVLIPSEVTYIGVSAFSWSKRLLSIKVDANNQNYSSLDGILCSKDGTILQQAPAGKMVGTYVIPSTITTVRGEAFKGCEKLVSVVIPSSVTLLTGGWTFARCHALKEVLCLSGGLNVPVDQFYNCGSNPTVYCAAADVPAWENAGEGSAVAFDIKAPASFGVPDTITDPAILSVGSSILSSSAFVNDMRIEWTGFDNTIASFTPSSDGRTVEISPIARGVFDATAKLVYGSGPDKVELDSAMCRISVIAPKGALPTVSDPNNADISKASWALSDAGVLTISSSEGETIGDLGWTWANWSDTWWGPVRNSVKSIEMDAGVKAVSTKGWFADMPSLVDLSGIFIPEGVNDASMMFAKGLFKAIPEGFTVPDSVVNASSMFGDCESLTVLPSSFNFSEATQLENITDMFNNCVSLSSLPEGFLLPNTVGKCDGIFRNCPQLTSLPKSFSFTDTIETALQPFFISVTEDEPRLTTRYLGNELNVLNYNWASQGRTLVTDTEDRGMYELTYQVQAPTEPFDWETHSTVLTNTSGIATDPGIPTLDGYTFTGWSTDEDCMEPFDFSTPLTSATTLYGKWIKRGGKEAGALPLTQGSTGSSWWQITADGTLMIMGDGTIADFNWYWDSEVNDKVKTQHWGAYRSEVKSIVMGADLGARNMTSWFQEMPKLTNIDGVRIPDGTISTHCLFKGCVTLSVIPDDFHTRIPETTTNIRSMFNTCKAIFEIPEEFSIPSWVTDMGALFTNSSIESVPDSFLIPAGVTDADEVFYGCTKLESLPEGFTIPDSVLNADQILVNCRSLKALPEGFSVSKNLKKGGMDKMLSGCISLTYLPASFDFPLAIAETADDPFKCFTMTETYFAGGADSSSNILKYSKWQAQNRKIVIDVPADKFKISLMLPNSETGVQVPWTTQLVSKDVSMTEPVAPIRSGYAFLGWYQDEAFTAKFDFTKPITNDTSLYARYYQRSGSLPTTDGQDNASWSLSENGVLSISCTNDAVIRLVKWTWDACTEDYWGPLRDFVKRLDMNENVRAQNMNEWFAYMPNLVDASSGFFIPEGCTSATCLFFNSKSLTMLPENFTLPLSMNSTNAMFQYCVSLKVLPDEFSLPRGVVTATHMFRGAGITALSEGFSVPETMTSSYKMFEDCKDLASLPAGFRLAEGVNTLNEMFSGCTSLASLPVGFSIPTSATDVTDMFSNCPNLRTLPASLKLSGLASVTGFNTLFALPATVTDPIPTYYAGSASDVPDQTYWATNYNRTLSTRSDPLPEGSHRVTFKLEPAGTTGFIDWTTVVTDKTGKVPNPGIPTQFGYAFPAWYTDASCTIPYDFERDTVATDTELYGKYTLVVRYEAPLSAKVSIDATGKTTPAPVQFVSYTPVALKVESVQCIESNAAQDVFPQSSDRAKMAVELHVGSPRPLYVYFNDSVSSNKLAIPAAGSASSPGIFDYGIGFDLPENTLINYWGNGWTTDVARLEYTVGLG